MNSFVVVVFLACLAASNAGSYHGPSAKVIQGPSSKTTLVGPEGSVISATAPGGQIIHEEHPGVVGHSAPLLTHATPALAYTSHSTAHHVPVVSHVPAVAYSAHAVPVAHAYGHADTIVAGPSGTIATGHSHGTPVLSYSASHIAPVVAHHAGHVAPVAAYATFYNAHGHDGQYVHDNTESLYDDGSYKPHLYHH